MKQLVINKEMIPISMLMVIEGNQYQVEFQYNNSYDFFTVSLSQNDIQIITGEKVVLGKPLFTSIGYPFEETYFIPLDLSGENHSITYDNFNETVLLYEFAIVNDEVVNDE